MSEDDTNIRIRAAIASYTAAATASPEAARATLVREGIYLEDGRLAPEYGGPERSS
jgi:hypothetical protein